MLKLRDISKRYGHTQALDRANVTVEAGEILGLVGHNGAGKSTLMRVITGLTSPEEGMIEFDGQGVTDGYSLAVARSIGIRIAFQELSLCPTLRVYENVVVSRPDLGGPGWQRRARDVIDRRLGEIFPDNGISPNTLISRLSLAERQMAEIAQATLGGEGASEVKLLILDEPTSALASEEAQALFHYLLDQSQAGLATIVISHRLHEIFANSHRVVVMRDGGVVARRSRDEVDADEVVALMGASEGESAAMREERRKVAETAPVVVETRGLAVGALKSVSIKVREGEIVGLAGLEGQGQQILLHELWRRRKRTQGPVESRGGMAFVTGDRQTSGVFPLSSLARNVSVSSMRSVARFGMVRPDVENRLARHWIDRLDIKGEAGSPILDLSGGTQQKGLVARALAAPARVILLDDPFRGVDVATRRETYRMLREETVSGRSFVWYTTENAELAECDRVYVFRDGAVVKELAGAEISEGAVVAASFAVGREDSS